ncbi:sensor histidine kinase [Thioflexithrix psekupsensis]|uniref:histidine kinase n=1 Tax=Thioflexithrix psekupsensis TaxID=1570016 RepID=A0A251XBG1_9GAMM|nr:ATP-binding protein [Thioflexithrix psekupsensis]OUD15430.1 hypothetical protein TPSD3_02565 [Thioflexithrix psekupsensis]
MKTEYSHLEHFSIRDLILEHVSAPTENEIEWQPLYLFNIYRMIIVVSFLVFFISDISPSFLGRYDGALFLMTGWLYFGFALLSSVATYYRRPDFQIQVLVQILVDILAIILLMHASGGIESGMGVLITVVIAAGSLLAPGRNGLFFAAIASLAILFHVSLADLYYWFTVTSYTHAGMLGISFFSTAVLSLFLAQRIRESKILAQQRGLHVLFLAQLNEQIVQNIQSGIIVIDTFYRIQLVNETAKRLLGLDANLDEVSSGESLYEIKPELTDLLKQWQDKKSGKIAFNLSSDGFELIVNFKELWHEKTVSTLIVLEDAALTKQRAQQLKLISLGRLAAGIAHEVRNRLLPINYSGHLLAGKLEHRLDETEKEVFNMIIKNGERIQKIVNSILQLSRQHNSVMQPLLLNEWIQDFIWELMQEKYLDQEDVVLHCPDEPLWINFDPHQLHQVIYNLCDNALRYSMRRNEPQQPLLNITIGFNMALRKVYCEVKDYGDGMSPEIESRLFEPFATTESSGTGLGLYFSKELTNANWANLTLWENSQSGCRFRIHFHTITEPQIESED